MTFRGVKLFCMILSWWIHVIKYLLKPMDCTTSRVNSHVNYGLWMCPCRLMNCNKCTTQAPDVNSGRLWEGQGE